MRYQWRSMAISQSLILVRTIGNLYIECLGHYLAVIDIVDTNKKCSILLNICGTAINIQSYKKLDSSKIVKRCIFHRDSESHKRSSLQPKLKI